MTPTPPESMVDQSQATRRAGMAVKSRAMPVTAGRGQSAAEGAVEKEAEEGAGAGIHQR